MPVIDATKPATTPERARITKDGKTSAINAVNLAILLVIAKKTKIVVTHAMNSDTLPRIAPVVLMVPEVCKNLYVIPVTNPATWRVTVLNALSEVIATAVTSPAI